MIISIKNRGVMRMGQK